MMFSYSTLLYLSPALIFTNSYHIGDNTAGNTYDLNWSNTFSLNDYTSVKFRHYSQNTYYDIFNGYRCPHQILNYTVTITFSK